MHRYRLGPLLAPAALLVLALLTTAAAIAAARGDVLPVSRERAALAPAAVVSVPAREPR